MIPNIHNKAVFDSEFDLDKAQMLYKLAEASHVYYKLKRNSDFLEYSLLLIDYQQPSSYNNFLQTILNTIPMTKSGFFLELFTIYAWEHKKTQKIAILMEKFDEFLISHSFLTENELVEVLGKTLRFVLNLTSDNFHFFGLENIVIRNKSLKLIALESTKTQPKFLLLDSQSNNGPISQIIDFFTTKNLTFNSPKVAKILSLLAQSQPSSPTINHKKQKHTLSTSLENTIAPILEEFYQASLISPQFKPTKTLSFAPFCFFCSSNTNSRKMKKSSYFCKSPDCMKPFCIDCLKEHKKSGQNMEIVEFEDFLKNEIISGDSLRLLEESLLRTPQLEQTLENKYSNLKKEVGKFFSFLETQVLKLLNAKKETVLAQIEASQEEDDEKLQVIQLELERKQQELIKLRETNEVRTPYLQEDLDIMLPFLCEFRFEFQPELNRKMEDLKKGNQDYIQKIMQRNSEFSNIMLNFGIVLENILKIPSPFLETLDVEKLRNTALEAKPVFYAKHPEKKKVCNLINLEERGFLAVYENDQNARVLTTATTNQEYSKGVIAFNFSSMKKIKDFNKDKLLILSDHEFFVIEVLPEKLSVLERIKIDKDRAVFSEIEGFYEESLVFIGSHDYEEIHVFSFLNDS